MVRAAAASCCAADLVDDDDLRHVVFHRLDHHLMLQVRAAATCIRRASADGRVRNIAIAADFVGRIHDDHPRLIAQNPGSFAQQRRLADAGPAQQQDALARLDDILDDINHAVDRAPDATGQPDDPPLPVANARNPVQRPLDPGPVVIGKLANAFDDVVDVLVADLAVAQNQLIVGEAGLWQPAQVHDDFKQLVRPVGLAEGMRDVRRKNVQQDIKVVGYLLLRQSTLFPQKIWVYSKRVGNCAG